MPAISVSHVRHTGVALYVGAIVLAFAHPIAPRVFWTMALPVLLIAIVLMGFNTWRRICPLAFFGDLGRLGPKPEKVRRVPAWIEEWFFLVSLTVLISMLALRLVATNGDGRWLGGLLIVLALAAAAANKFFTGKSWCNFFCPVGVVERFYTEPHSLRTAPTSQCAKCTACKKNCPDIDQENGYWYNVMHSSRRIAYYAFPGIVLAFYTYFWLRTGTWDAYFSGAWTVHAASADTFVGPGFFFAPAVPALLAIFLTFAVFGGASFLLFVAVEHFAARRWADAELRRHRTLTAAAFTAFNVFYLFAGAPWLLRIPRQVGVRIAAFLVPTIAAIVLTGRWRRDRQSYVQEKGVRKLAEKWPYKEPQPKELSQVAAFYRGHQEARGVQLEAYTATVRELLAGGIVLPGNLSVLNAMRLHLGITDAEHRGVLKTLSVDETRLDPKRAAGVERDLQLAGYREALTAVLAHRGSPDDIELVRRDFGVSAEEQKTMLQSIRSSDGALTSRVAAHVDRVRVIRTWRSLSSLVPVGAARDFLQLVLDAEERAVVEHVARLSAAAGVDPASIASESTVPAEAGRNDALAAMLTELAASLDPFDRAAAVLAMGEVNNARFDALITSAAKDEHAVVRDAVRLPHPPVITRMLQLRSVPMLAGLDPGELYDVALIAREEVVAWPAFLCQQNDVTRDAYLILEGRASVSIDDASGLRRIAELGPGDVVGELAAIDGGKRTASVAPSDGFIRVLRIDADAFRGLLQSDSSVALQVASMLARRVRVSLESA